MYVKSSSFRHLMAQALNGTSMLASKVASTAVRRNLLV
jgi:hypothetical protein